MDETPHAPSANPRLNEVIAAYLGTEEAAHA